LKGLGGHCPPYLKFSCFIGLYFSVKKVVADFTGHAKTKGLFKDKPHFSFQIFLMSAFFDFLLQE